jgi:hypothetical protein
MDQNIKFIYLLDSNSFITPYRQYYKFSIVPSFWEKLNYFAEKKLIVSIKQVYEEICIKNGKEKDELQKWIENKFKCEFIDTYADLEIINNYKLIMNYLQANNKEFTPKAITIWANNKTADAWIIATAMTDKNKYIIVSFEGNRDNKNNPKITTIAKVFGIKCINLFEIMEQLNFSI